MKLVMSLLGPGQDGSSQQMIAKTQHNTFKLFSPYILEEID